jgi:peptidyl-prolyl cis-trans isomerase D
LYGYNELFAGDDGKNSRSCYWFSTFCFYCRRSNTSPGSSFFKGDANEIGEVNGQQIKAMLILATSVRCKAHSSLNSNLAKAITPQVNSYLQETTWNTYLTPELLLNKEIRQARYCSRQAESQAMISGNNPDPQIQRQFVDPANRPV